MDSTDDRYPKKPTASAHADDDLVTARDDDLVTARDDDLVTARDKSYREKLKVDKSTDPGRLKCVVIGEFLKVNLGCAIN
jgi:hypothetical protein